jgi:integrase
MNLKVHSALKSMNTKLIYASAKIMDVMTASVPSLPTQQDKQTQINSVKISKYIKNVSTMNKTTAYVYLRRLMSFQNFVSNVFNLTVDELIRRIDVGNEDVFEVINEFSSYLSNSNISSNTVKQRVVTIKNFLEYHDIDISPRKFKLKIKLPKSIRKDKEALSKEDITDILNACSDIRLKTYIVLLASTGMRAQEALSLRIKDLDLERSIPARFYVRGEYTKTRTDRIAFLTKEMTLQLKLWIDYKYRTRRVTYNDQQNIELRTKTVTEYRIPIKNESDLVFAVYQNKSFPKPYSLYQDLVRSFAKTLDRMGKGAREDGNRRRRITLHSFRRFVKTTISDLGYADYSEYFIGHSGSTYWRKKDSEKAEIFRKIEPYLTFLNVHQLERQGADIQTKVEELEHLNQSMRDRDKMKDDAIAHLSDQLIAITGRLQELERRQITA